MQKTVTATAQSRLTPSTENIKPTTYAQLLVPAVTFIIVIAAISVLLIFLLENHTRNQTKVQSLLCLQLFVFFVGQVSPATTPGSAVVLQGNSSWEELHFPELLVQLSFCAGGERQHVYLGEHRYSCCRLCLPVAAILSPCNKQQEDFGACSAFDVALYNL